MSRTKNQVVLAYHGGPEPIQRFSPKHGAQGLMWFSEDRDKVARGDSGALSTKYLMTVKLKVGKVAGWKEYDDLLLGQIFSKTYGFDAIRLDHGDDGADWALVDPRRVEVVTIEERPAGGWPSAKGHAAGRAGSPQELKFAAVPARFRADAERVYDWLVAQFAEDDAQHIARWGKPLSARYGFNVGDVSVHARDLADLSTRRLEAVFTHLYRAGLIERVNSTVVDTEHRARMGTRFGAPKKTVHSSYVDVKFRAVTEPDKLHALIERTKGARR